MRKLLYVVLAVFIQTSLFGQQLKASREKLSQLRQTSLGSSYSPQLKDEYIRAISTFFDEYNHEVQSAIDAKERWTWPLVGTPLVLAPSAVYVWHLASKASFKPEAMLSDVLTHFFEEEIAMGKLMVNGQAMESGVDSYLRLPQTAGSNASELRSSAFSVFRPNQIFPYVNTQNTWDGHGFIRPLRIDIGEQRFITFANMELYTDPLIKGKSRLRFSGPEMMMGHRSDLGTIVLVNEKANQEQVVRVYQILEDGFRRYYDPAPFIGKAQAYYNRQKYIEDMLKREKLDQFVTTFTRENIDQLSKTIFTRAKLAKTGLLEIAEDLIRYQATNQKPYWLLSENLAKAATFFKKGTPLTTIESVQLKHWLRLTKGSLIVAGTVGLTWYAVSQANKLESDPVLSFALEINKQCSGQVAGQEPGCVGRVMNSKNYSGKELETLLRACDDFANAK